MSSKTSLEKSPAQNVCRKKFPQLHWNLLSEKQYLKNKNQTATD